jgi:hypothetical protein
VKVRKQDKKPVSCLMSSTSRACLGLATDTSASSKVIPYEDAVAEGKKIVAEIEDTTSRGQLRLGELADKVETKYGDRTQAKFAAEIGVAPCTLKRYRTVYRDWKGAAISAPGRFSVPYSVLRELQTHPDRAEIIRKEPNITKREAHSLMRKLKGVEEEQQQEEQENGWRKDNRRWFRELYNHTLDVSRMVGMARDLPPEKQRELLQVVEPLMLMNMGGYGRMLVDFVDRFEALLEEAGTKDGEVSKERAPQEVMVQTAAQ